MKNYLKKNYYREDKNGKNGFLYLKSPRQKLESFFKGGFSKIRQMSKSSDEINTAVVEKKKEEANNLIKDFLLKTPSTNPYCSLSSKTKYREGCKYFFAVDNWLMVTLYLKIYQKFVATFWCINFKPLNLK